MPFLVRVWPRRENNAKCMLTSNVKFFTTFRAGGYKRHLEQQYDRKWAENQQLSTTEEKEAFFSQVSMPFLKALAAHGSTMRPFYFTINVLILNVIIGEHLFHPDDIEGVRRQLAMSHFFKVKCADPANKNFAKRKTYQVVVENAKHFNLLVTFVG